VIPDDWIYLNAKFSIPFCSRPSHKNSIKEVSGHLVCSNGAKKLRDRKSNVKVCYVIINYQSIINLATLLLTVD